MSIYSVADVKRYYFELIHYCHKRQVEDGNDGAVFAQFVDAHITEAYQSRE